MPETRKFLLGFGERLTRRIAPPTGGPPPGPPYTLEEAVQRLSPETDRLSESLDSLPRLACPNDEAVGVITLHPQSIAKSYHPQELLTALDLRQVGSRPVDVLPEQWTRDGDPVSMPSSELYVAGHRENFRRWASLLAEGGSSLPAEALRRIEAVRAPRPTERMRGLPESEVSVESLSDSFLEVVLHASEAFDAEYIVRGFERYAQSLGASVEMERRLYAGGLCFVPVSANAGRIAELAEYAFLRVARPMPRLRDISPIERSEPIPGAEPCDLPDLGPIDANLRVAVLDGGLQADSELNRWASAFDAPGVGNPDNRYLAHGHDVTSAMLFGPLDPGGEAERPYAHVDHHRILDDKCGSDPFDLYEVLRRVDTILSERNYEFVNLSLGPALPVADDEVHPWTAILDKHLADGHALLTVAAGNNGARDAASGEARIQVPADCVNAMAIGAADSVRQGWRRANYSAIGPGRSPGIVKPDVLHFGGCGREPFIVYDRNLPPYVAQTWGTSFASPSTLRLAVGVRAHFGSRLSPLALKALLVHGAEAENYKASEVGWGRIPSSIDDLVVCPPSSVRVVYQGEIGPSNYVRAEIPLPSHDLKGRVKIRATFCFATEVDPSDPGTYTKSGLEITFRPDFSDFEKPTSTDPAPDAFFKRSAFDPEQLLRKDAKKWETVLHQVKGKLGKSLRQPMFDIHYNARSSGGMARDARPIKYALVVTVSAARHSDLYESVVREYAGRLEVLEPIIEVPVRVSP